MGKWEQLEFDFEAGGAQSAPVAETQGQTVVVTPTDNGGVSIKITKVKLVTSVTKGKELSYA